ncbi:MAG: hypothetical protein R2794_04630 [Chitinophagales bacterium]
MQIPIAQFEQYIDETILKRGLSYFRNGRVNTPEEISPGQFEAIVEGTEDYIVRILVKNNTISEFSCDCPYADGPVCKHVTALIFYLQQEELDLPAAKSKKKTRNKPVKRKTVIEQVDELLTTLPVEVLHQYIKEQVANDMAFRRKFLSHFAHLNTNESKATYAKEIKAILRQAAGRGGFIDWRAVRNVGKAVQRVLESAQNHLNKGNGKSAFFIACAVLEEMTKAFQFADDSNGDIGSAVEGAYYILSQLSEEDLPEELRLQLFDYALTAYQKNIFVGWDWHLGMLEIAAFVIRSNAEEQQVIDLLDQIKQEKFDYNYRIAQEIKLNILKKTQGEKAAEAFIAKNLSNPSIRTEAIQNAIHKKDFAKAKALAKEGIQQDEKERPGLVADWQNYLLEIALKEKDKENSIHYARVLLIHDRSSLEPYFGILKQQVPKKDWSKFLENLIHELEKTARWNALILITQIYVAEEMWEDLFLFLQFEFAKGSIDIEFMESYEKYLAKQYSEQIAFIYKEGIERIVEHGKGRNEYKRACRYIRRMIKLGARQMAESLIAELRTNYPARKALLEELNAI